MGDFNGASDGSVRKPDFKNYVSNLVHMNGAIFLLIADNWNADDLINLESIAKMMSARVTQALQHRDEFRAYAAPQSTMLMTKYLDALLRCDGQRLRKVYLKTDSNVFGFVLAVKPDWINLLALQCPNIQTFAPAAIGPLRTKAGRNQPHFRPKHIAAYAEYLNGSFKLQVMTFDTGRPSELADVYRTLRRCDQIQMLKIVKDMEFGECANNLLQELMSYKRKAKATEVEEIEFTSRVATGTRTTAAYDFDLNVLNVFRGLKRLSMDLHTSKDCPSNFKGFEVLAQVVASYEQLSFELNTNSIGIVVLFSKNIEKLCLDQIVDFSEKRSALRSVRFPSLKLLELKNPKADFLALLTQDSKVFANAYIDVRVFKGALFTPLDSFVEFLKSRGTQVKCAKYYSVVSGRHDQLINTIANYCPNIGTAWVEICQLTHALKNTDNNYYVADEQDLKEINDVIERNSNGRPTDRNRSFTMICHESDEIKGYYSEICTRMDLKYVILRSAVKK